MGSRGTRFFDVEKGMEGGFGAQEASSTLLCSSLSSSAIEGR